MGVCDRERESASGRERMCEKERDKECVRERESVYERYVGGVVAHSPRNRME